MALSDTATLAVGTGHFWLSPTNTAPPATLAALLAPASPWAEVGHTSLENIIAFSSDGGDVTTLGTLQSPTLRSVVAPRVESLQINLNQWDLASLLLYFGSNAAEISGGSIYTGVPSAPAVTTKAFLGVIIDGSTKFAFFAPKAEIFRGDDIDFSDTSSLTQLPLKITPLNYSTNTWAYAVTALT
jgi:hypothetical protein